MTQFAGQRLLVAPLDWGLGHATRCIPVIKALLQLPCHVWLAGEGAQEILLRKEFPQLPFLRLEGYRIRYAASGFTWNILRQFPKMNRAIKTERQWLHEKMDALHFDTVISDNRYGLYHEKAFCIFMTHQLCIKNPLGQWGQLFLQRWNYKYINRFNECWVPDEAGENNLAGALSHPAVMPRIPVRYAGMLSRFEKRNKGFIKDHLLVLLSGPEPQRSILENKILRELMENNLPATVVRGLPGENKLPGTTGSINIYNHLTSADLQTAIENAEWVIARSGYSTVMDLVSLQKKSILIPTPGQPEQEYLAGYLQEKAIACSADQKKFSLLSMLEKAKNFQYRFVSPHHSTTALG